MKFIHITDTHLVKPGVLLYGLDPYARLTACIDDVVAEHSDAVACVITGDLAHKGDRDAYVGLRTQLARLPMPVFPLMGNHDLRELFAEEYPQVLRDRNGFVQGVFDTPQGRFLMLDTLDEGRSGGLYCAQRPQWLREQLDAAGDQPVYLFMHHPPFDIGIPCLDVMRLHDEAAVTELVVGRPNIRHLFFGHVHRPVCGSWRGIPYSTMRGLNHQVPLDLYTPSPVPKSLEPPAYAVVFLSPDQVTVHFHDYLDTSALPIGTKAFASCGAR